MLAALSDDLAAATQGNAWLALLAALLGGLLTAANPCVIAMVPLMIGYVGGQQQRGVFRSFLLSLTFTIGLTAMFAVLALGVLSASSLLPARVWPYVAAAVCLLMGLHLLGILDVRLPAAPGVQPRQRGFIGALLLGLLFGLISLPCAGPVLLALLSIVPLRGATFGMLLLVAYSIGHCGLILVGGTSMGLVQKMADSRGWTRGTQIVRTIAGALIVAVGLYVLFRV